ncbi:MAG: DUF998 domain-containing protein [Anaerolineae bacterium]|nr:DUF998 domain-containing protein [Anaerolineae bacterium]
MKLDRYRLTYIAGFLGSIIITVASVITALAYVGKQGQAYSPLNHFVSELGEVGVSPAAAVFNTGLIVGGVFLVIFLVGLATLLKGWFRYLFALFGVVSGVSGVLVGVFPMNNLAAHTQVALTFFNTGWIMVGLFSLYILFVRPPPFPLWLIIPGIITVLSFIAFLNSISGLTGDALAAPTDRVAVWNVTIFEWMLIGGVMVWVFLIALRLYLAERASALLATAKSPA